jgi:CRP/FNR family cyclic AMP-dependent transcriptional regulator
MTRAASLIDMVKDHGILKDLDPRYIEKLVNLALEAYFQPDQIVFREGDLNGTFYLLVSGTIALEMLPYGRAIRVQTLHEGDPMGFSALLENRGKQFQARATSHVHALAFEGQRVRQAFEEDPAFGYVMMKRLLTTVTERLDATRVQVAEMYGKSGQ